MKPSQMMAVALACMTAFAMQPGYRGKPFRDQIQ
jgi:hypothetical protein